MIQLQDKKHCFGCGACADVCSAGAITMKPDAEGFLYPVVDEAACASCGLCEGICPGLTPAEALDGQAYALRCNDQSLLQKSSSGGAFSLLAQQVLASGGLVCGAVFDEGFTVRHVISEDIAPMRKSKYVQSDMTQVYGAVEQALAAGKQVLFTGTPCQCDAMHRRFEEKKGLVLAALICRGVQSPELWREYTAYLAGDGKLEAYCFRDKRLKNDGHTVSCTVSGQERAVSMGNDPFNRLYMKCLTFRPSCYSCPYTRWELPFDLTIGDFWGVEKVYPELADGMGTSLVIARTEAGKALLEGLREQALVKEVSREAAMQPALREPARETMLRKLLYRDLARKDDAGRCDMALILKKYGG